MKISRQAAAENRERIAQNAARLFRERGLSGVGIDELAGAAGLTSGSLYNHFGSKEGLIAEAVDAAFADFAARMNGNTNLANYLDAYLSPDHRDNRGGGCAVATMGSEAPRQSEAVRASFTKGIKGLVGRMKARLSPEQPDAAREDAAWMTMATLVGTLVLARTVDDPVLSDRILAQGRARVMAIN